MNSIVEHAAKLHDKTVATRRDLHKHPEIAFEEVRTAGIVADRLREIGYSPRTGVGQTGVVAVLDTGRPGPTVLARGDMDALPITEEKEVEYRSTTLGNMHACGHDGHTAVLLSVAEIIWAMQEELTGKVIFVFQPAEEVVAGAKAMLDDGALDGHSVDHVLGLHLSSGDPVGTVTISEGPIMAATDSYRLVVKGKGGHAAYPHLCIDPILAASQVVSALQPLVSRETDPMDRAVVSITSFNGGTAYNIIPGEVELKGTLRTFDADTRARLRERIVQVAKSTAEAGNCTFEHEWREGPPSVVNDAGEVARMRRVAVELLGEENVKPTVPAMGGEDMAYFMQLAKGCFFFVGTQSSDATGYAHHHPRFDIDEEGLKVGVKVFASGIADLLRPAS